MLSVLYAVPAQFFANSDLQASQVDYLRTTLESLCRQTDQAFEVLLYIEAQSEACAAVVQQYTRYLPRLHCVTAEQHADGLEAMGLTKALLQSAADRTVVVCVALGANLLPRAFADIRTRFATDATLDFLTDQPVATLQDPVGVCAVRQTCLATAGWLDTSISLYRNFLAEYVLRLSLQGNGLVSSSQLVENVEATMRIKERNYSQLPIVASAILEKFVAYRDLAAWPRGLDAALFLPPERIPSGEWKQVELECFGQLHAQYFRLRGNSPMTRKWQARLATGAGSVV